jgi:hypothetical protein
MLKKLPIVVERSFTLTSVSLAMASQETAKVISQGEPEWILLLLTRFNERRDTGEGLLARWTELCLAAQ